MSGFYLNVRAAKVIAINLKHVQIPEKESICEV